MWQDSKLTEKWAPVLEGISDAESRATTAKLLENQAKSIIADRVDEDITTATTTVGKLGTFQKFAFPLIRRVYPELIANSICGVQPMQGPVSQIFYLGHTRSGEDATGTRVNQTVYSQFLLTHQGLTASGIGSTSGPGATLATGDSYWEDPAGGEVGASLGVENTGLDLDVATEFDTSNVIAHGAGGAHGTPDTTVGGKIASFPDSTTTLGWNVSAGERLKDGGIPEIAFHIEQQAVVARTRKMRALWTLEASQDLRAYHDMDLERELTGLLSQELQLEIDRELVEDIRMLAYDVGRFGNWKRDELNQGNPNSFNDVPGKGPFEADGGASDGSWQPAAFTYDFNEVGLTTTNTSGAAGNVFVIDFSASAIDFAPQHMGHVYANLLAVLNLASQDIYKTTWRGPGSWLLTSPLVASMLESAAKLEGGVQNGDGPSNMGGGKVEYRGKFAGKYDLYVDPLYPEDEILMGYKGKNAMDAGFCYCPYIPLQQIPTITDPHTFQPRKGILTRYGKAAIEPASRFYRVIRIVGPTANYLFSPFQSNSSNSVS